MAALSVDNPVIQVEHHSITAGGEVRWQRWADRAIFDEVAAGLNDDCTCARGTLLCAPHVGGLEFYEIMHGKCETGVESGRASASSSLPF